MQELITNIAPNLASKLPDFYKALGDTLLMVLWSGAISFVLGLALGVLLVVTRPGGILEHKILYQIVDKLVSLFRSIPFIILLTWVMPITRALAGTVLYVRGAIVPLVFGSVPYFTRQVQSAIRYGHDRNMADITNVTVFVLVLLVCIIEFVGGRVVKKNTH